MTDNSALVSIGFGNIVSGSRIIAVITPDSAPVKRLIQDARERRLLIDASCGRKTRAVLIMDSGNHRAKAERRMERGRIRRF